MKEFLESLELKDLKKIAKKFKLDDKVARIALISNLETYITENSVEQSTIEEMLVKKVKEVAEDTAPESVDEEPVNEGDDVPTDFDKQVDNFIATAETDDFKHIADAVDADIVKELIEQAPENSDPHAAEAVHEVLAEVVNQEEFQQHINDGAIEFEAPKEEESFFEKLEDKVEEVLEKAEDKLEEVAHRIEEKVEEVIDMVEDSTPVQGLSAAATRWYKYLNYMKGKRDWQEFISWFEVKYAKTFKFWDALKEIKVFLKIK